MDCSGLEKHNRTPAELNQVFKQCCVKYLYTILDGKLFRCPFIANANKLGAIPDNKGDYVQLINPSDRVATEIRKLVGQSHFFPGCDFCVGRPYDATDTIGYDGKGIIKAGKQTSEILPYKLAEMTNE